MPNCPITNELINEIRDINLQTKQELLQEIIELKSVEEAAKGGLLSCELPLREDLIILSKMMLVMGIYIGYKIKEKEYEVGKLEQLNSL
jgi:hypothetical protein